MDILGYNYNMYNYDNILCLYLFDNSTLMKLGMKPECIKYSPSSIMIKLFRNVSININDLILFNTNLFRRTGCINNISYIPANNILLRLPNPILPP